MYVGDTYQLWLLPAKVSVSHITTNHVAADAAQGHLRHPPGADAPVSNHPALRAASC